MEWVQAFWQMIVAHWGWITVAALPFVASAVARCNWSSAAKGWTAIAVCAVYGIAGAFVAGIAMTPQNLSLLLAAVAGGCQVAYLVFKSNKVTAAWLESLLALGSPKIE